jgi:hypothetical protein
MGLKELGRIKKSKKVKIQELDVKHTLEATGVLSVEEYAIYQELLEIKDKMNEVIKLINKE